MAERNTTKQRRQARNRALREARVARTAAAARQPDDGAAASTSAVAADARAGAGRRARLARPDRPGRAGRRRPPQISPTARADGSLLSLFAGAVPGAKAVGMGLVFALTATLSLLFLPFVEREVQSGGGDVTVETSTLLEEGGGFAVAVLAVPLLVAVVAAAWVRRPSRRRVWSITAVAMVAWVAVTLASVGIYYAFSAAALGVGAWQVRKAERAEHAEGTASAPAEDPEPPS